MQTRLNSILKLSRAALRLSTVLRVLWMAVALLHVWLIVRRCVAGDWTQITDYLRGGLCLVAVGYASLKVWRVATIFDNEPRRAWVFALVLLLGHAFTSQPTHDAQAFSHGDTAALVAALAVVPALGLGLLLTLLSFAFFFTLDIPRAHRRIQPAGLLRDWLTFHPRNLLYASPPLFRRPPPRSY